MFEEYLQDAYEFMKIAQKAFQRKEEREARRYYRASVFYAAGALEAFINYIADSFAKAESLTQHEISFLNDKRLVFEPQKVKVVEKIEFHRIDDKLRLILKKFVPTFDFNCASWSNLMAFKDFRDSLVHPRKSDDETAISEYQKRVRNGLTGIIETMNCVSNGLFHKPLRQKLLDLIPD